MHLFPKQGDRGPWRHTQNYMLDKKMIRDAPLEDGSLLFTNPLAETPTSEPGSEPEEAERTANAA
jgi:hypothetical protein